MRDYIEVYDLYLAMQAEMSFGQERAIFDFPEFYEAGTIIDAGCGNAAYTRLLAQAFPNKEIIGIDADEALLDRAHRRHLPGNLKLIHADINEFPAGLHAEVLVSRLVSMYLKDPRRLAEWASRHVEHAVIIDAADDLFSVHPPMPLFAKTEVANAERIRGMGGNRSNEREMVSIWASTDYSLHRELDIFVQSSTPFAKYAMHHMVRLHAELAVGNPLPPDLIEEIFAWSIDATSYLQYGLRARHFARTPPELTAEDKPDE